MTPDERRTAARISGRAALPAASVILPVYNAGLYMETAIASVLEQSFADFELLLLDDGSSDNSLEIMHGFAKLDSRCIVHTRANLGLVATLNEGIARARAEIVIRMDADDRSHRNRFEQQMTFLHRNPRCVAVGTDAMLIDPDGRALRRWGVPTDHARIDAEHMRGKGGMIVHPAAAIRKSALVRVGCYRENFRYAEDLDLFLRLAEIGELCNLPDVLFEYRLHLNSVGRVHRVEQVSAGSRALAEARRRRGIVVDDKQGNESPSPVSEDEVHRTWAWWALSAGNISTARTHALKALRIAPLARENLRLIACVLRGR